MGSGVASLIVFLFLLRIPWKNAARTPQVCPKQGLRWDCDRYESPAGKNRVCLVHGTGQVEWYTGTDSIGCNRDRLTSRDFSSFCPGYVGMNMSLNCVVANASIYKDGVPLSDEPTVTFFNGLRAEDEGLYQCRRRGSLEVIHKFNMTVQSKILIMYCTINTCTHMHDIRSLFLSLSLYHFLHNIILLTIIVSISYRMHVVTILFAISIRAGEIHIGGASDQECVPFFCDLSPISQRKCCYYVVHQLSREYYSEQPVSLSVYGDAPISISLAVEWITDSTVHYPTDLSPYIDRIPTNPIDWVSRRAND